jgi:hypothetical protein
MTFAFLHLKIILIQSESLTYARDFRIPTLRMGQHGEAHERGDKQLQGLKPIVHKAFTLGLKPQPPKETSLPGREGPSPLQKLRLKIAYR